MTVGIVGSRKASAELLDRVAAFVFRLAEKHPGAVVVSGGARGVDRTAEETAHLVGLPFVSYRVVSFDSMYDRKLYTVETVTEGEPAQAIVVAKSRRISPPAFPTFAQTAFFRNGWIVDDSEQLVAFWDGSSPGTADTLERARLAGVPQHVYREEVAA